MSANFTIKNPKANNVIGMYVDEPFGMDHPLCMVRFQGRIDAGWHFENAVPIQVAIQSTLKRMRFLFGDDIPEELVRTLVSLVYAENAVFQEHEELIKSVKPIDIKGRVDVNGVKKINNEVSKVEYPKIYVDTFMGGVGHSGIPANATKDELVAEAVRIVMDMGRRACVAWSESENIYVEEASWRSRVGKKYPHIAVYGKKECILFYPDAMTKDGLIAKAEEIVATWCPRACVVWSSNETIWPKPPQQDVIW